VGGEASTIIQLDDDESKTGPVEEIQDDVVAAPAMQAAVIGERSDEAVDVTPARRTEIINCFGDLVGWLTRRLESLKWSRF